MFIMGYAGTRLKLLIIKLENTMLYALLIQLFIHTCTFVSISDLTAMQKQHLRKADAKPL